VKKLLARCVVLPGAEMSVFSPLNDEDDANNRATNSAMNSEDARLSLTTQLLPQSSSRVSAACNRSH